MPTVPQIERLVAGFDSTSFRAFVNEKFSGNFAPVQRAVPVDDNAPWAHAGQLGIVKHLPGSNGINRPLLVVSAELPGGEMLRERSSRLKQFHLARMVLEDAVSNPSPDIDGLPSQGLFVFSDQDGNFRLSLVYATPKGTKLEWSTFKRYSFYVEAGAGNKTFRDRVALPWTTFDQLSDAFSVEKLTKEFYRRLFDWYQQAMDSPEVVFPNDIVSDREPGAVKSEQIIRLITRLMFVWFLKQKHLVPDTLFDAEALREILREFDPAEGFTYYRAILQNLFFATLNSEIPDRAFAADGGSIRTNAEHFDIKTLYRYGGDFAWSQDKVLQLFHGIPFLNGGLFECLDPELLGKVFENLLAAYNPETNVQARKATGSFYTPREIVNYMVDESLIAHLTTMCGEEHETEIRTLFSEGVPPEDPKLSKRIDEALTTARILDPACGSGAFPMGALLRMVDVLRTVRRIPEDQSVCDLKLELIENAIYGADIQTIAVQISKLRFFISLIAEQQPTGDADNNYGIHSLPNLETKFVAANSLIGLPRRTDALPMHDVEDLKKHLWEVRHRHFQARSYREKKELREKDLALRTALAESLEDAGGFDTEAAHLMAAWDPYDQNTSATFLDPEWMFNVKDGFDVVIGNPPYLNVELISREAKAEYRKRFTTFYKRYDLFGLFFEAALTEMTNDKGKVALIVPQQIANNLSYKKLRDLMLDNHWLKEVLYLGDQVFEAANNDVCVITLSKSGNDKIRLVYALDFDNREETYVSSGFFLAYGNVISFKIDTSAESIHEKILSANGGRIHDSFKVFQGIVTGNNTAFLPTPNDISEFGIEEELLKPVLYGRDFAKWVIKGIDHKVLYVTSNTNLTDFPNAERWLHQFKERLQTRRECIRNVIPWYSLQWPRDKIDFESRSKILVQRTRNPRLKTRVVATLDENATYAMESVILLVPRDPGTDTRLLVGFLNSRLINFLFSTKFLNVAVKAHYLKAIALPVVDAGTTHRVVEFVSDLLATKESDPTADVSGLEAEIDQLVYKLYDLTPEEIAIVEQSTAAGSQAREAAPQPPTAEKTSRKKTTPDLPPSLPGWD